MAATSKVVDGTNVKERGQFNPRHKEPGDYLAVIVAVDDHTSKNGGDGWVATLQLDSDSRATYPYYMQLGEKTAFKVWSIFEAAGIPLPKKRVKIDPNRLVNREVGIALEDDEFNDRVKSSIIQVFPPVELEANASEAVDEEEVDEVEEIEDEEVDEEPPPPARKKAPAKRAPAKKAPAKKVADDEIDEDLDELDLDEDE